MSSRGPTLGPIETPFQMWAEPESNDTGWQHVGARPDMYGAEREEEHKAGFDRKCFQCWAEKHGVGADRIKKSGGRLGTQ